MPFLRFFFGNCVDVQLHVWGLDQIASDYLIVIGVCYVASQAVMPRVCR